MSFAEFQQSIAQDPAPPAGLSLALQALWHDSRGDWEKAHQAAQQEANPAGSWVHAYLHRQEGDPTNARYWYARAGKKPPAQDVELGAERDAIARALLGAEPPASSPSLPAAR